VKNFEQLKGKDKFQTVVVGGGIVGAGIYRDLVLNGVETLIIDARDFSSQTSERSSKMLHGGIRYLENLDFSLVFEALHEKNLWLKIAPHLAREESFYLPVYQNAKRPLWMISLGLFLYDALSLFKNSPFKIKSTKECLKQIPILQKSGLSGAGVYSDGIMDDAKMTLEVIYDALFENQLIDKTLAYAINYTEVIKVKYNSHKQLSEITLKCHLSKIEKIIYAEKVVYALGPFTDIFLNQFPMYHWKNSLLPSKGSHLWIAKKDLPLSQPIVMTPKDEHGDRVIFVIPHGEKILVGTTEVPSVEPLFELKPSQKEINYLLKNLNEYFPQLNLTEENILSSFAGIRPLAKEDNQSSDRGKTSREHKIYQPLSHTFVIVGGKYTTFRVMGRQITQDICHAFHKPYNQDKTESVLRQQSVVLPFDWKLPSQKEIELICRQECPRTFNDLVCRRLSIDSRMTWSLKTEILFNDYFMNLLPLLNTYFKVTEEEIRAFQ
jgi:glycerol-3-phosphate dehydrogenase